MASSKQTFETRVIFSKRKTIELRFADANTLIIKAPKHTNKERIAEVLRLKKAWIEKTRRHAAERLPNPQLKEGEKVLFLGNWHHIKLDKALNKGFDLSQPGFIRLNPTLAQKGNHVLISVYRQTSRQLVEEYCHHYARKWQLDIGTIRITSAKTRWGSCSQKNNLNFSWRLAMTPKTAIEYVVAHECAHLVHRNHSKAFWQFLKQMMPHYEEGRQWLKKNGHKLPLLDV